ncbi:KamA family radical SAM protein [Methanococcoides sp. NM1]|uniref:KamA family radical SAM protein n=1 Tax=Methanococcoides sp. NM1 TaxID=1201013 RepID=UPI0010843787|nr:lysine 2,3-aminomutase [Methanococcoides sp. NM1]
MIYGGPSISDAERKKYSAYTLSNYKDIPQIQDLSQQHLEEIEIAARILPFRVNNYVVEELINWNDVPNDPIFTLTFPNRDMLLPQHYKKMADLLQNDAPEEDIQSEIQKIRLSLNPHPAGQLEKNVPEHDGKIISGMQHKYDETILFFPAQGQTCHAYCTFCFRWAQFIGMDELKFASREIELLISYLQEHPEIRDVLFTGGDPMTMSAGLLKKYIEPVLEADIRSLENIRIGTKSLSYWPQRFVSDKDSEDILSLFSNVTEHKKHMALMAHFNHPRELSTDIVKKAIQNIRATGAQIRTQSPLIAHINDDPALWEEMWSEQVRLGCVPYYMFMVRNTGAKHYFDVPMARAWEIFQKAYQNVSGLARTVRGPSMSTDPGKINILGVQEINDEKVFLLEFLQGRESKWVRKPFFAKYSPTVSWLTDLEPAFGKEKFFFE